MNVRLTIGLPCPAGMALQLIDLAERFWPDATIVTIDGRMEVVTHEPPEIEQADQNTRSITTRATGALAHKDRVTR